MLVVKALHISLVVAWFAGLFYLPRIFVNLAMVPAESIAERALATHGRQAIPFHDPTRRTGGGIWPVALAGLRILRRLAASQDDAGFAAGHLSLALWSPAQQFSDRGEYQVARLVPFL